MPQAHGSYRSTRSAAAKKKAAEWNEAHSVGEEVVYWNRSRKEDGRRGRTSSRAIVRRLEACVSVVGCPWDVPLSRIAPAA